MDFELLPVEEMLEVLKAEVNPRTCFEKLLMLAGRKCLRRFGKPTLP